MSEIRHILFFEPRIEGHHLSWLPHVVEAILDAGYEVTLAIDERSGEARKRIAARSERVLQECAILSAYDSQGRIRGGSKYKAAEECFEECGADEVFFNSMDEFTSSVFRKAAFGILPSSLLKGKISGIYIRPRPLDRNEKGFKNWLKRRGFLRMTHEGWFRSIHLLDEFLVKENKGKSWPSYEFIPDPWEGDFSMEQSEARQALGIPSDKTVLLHYGTASKRKGLHLLLEAWEESSKSDKLFLLVAGNQDKNPEEIEIIRKMESAGSAKLLNHYICGIEEKQIFRATDWVVMPYMSHYGSSTVLSIAAAANRPVLASDHHLLGKRVTKHKLGYTFRNKDVESLTQQLDKIAVQHNDLTHQFEGALKAFAKKTSKAAFTEAVQAAYPPLNQKTFASSSITR